MIKKITFAIAVDNANKLLPKHFGDAEKFILYNYENNELCYAYELVNKFREYDETHEHGTKKKGEAIAHFLKKNGVDILVSQQFGKNIQIVNRYFVAVLVSENTPKETIPTLKKHLETILSERKKNTAIYKHLNLKASILNKNQNEV